MKIFIISFFGNLGHVRSKLFVFFRNWEVSDKAIIEPRKTCREEKSDGSCGSLLIPKCVDRTVRCSALPNPNSVQTSGNSGCPTCDAKFDKIVAPRPNDYQVRGTKVS